MPIKYVPYFPNTVEGQAVLDNITRTQRVLRYRDNDKVYSRIKRGMPYYEVEKEEQVGNSENLVMRGECRSACAYLKEQGIKVDLVYIDPPFASEADYAKNIYIRKNPKLGDKIKKAEEELEFDELKGFEETMYGDIWQKEDYLNWMYENLVAIKSIMKKEAFIFVHLDWHIGHYVKILLDEVFGEDNYRNSIIVKRTKKNIRERDYVKSLNVASDSIFLYSKDFETSFYPPTKKEEKGERWHSFEAAGFRNGMDYELFGHKPSPNNHWRWQKERALKAVENYEEWKKNYSDKETLTEYWERTGKILKFIRSNPRTKKPEYFIPSSEETLCDTLWDDISAYSFKNNYVTEKSEELLNRILKIKPEKDITVADFFGGSGTTAKVACDLGKNFIHVDVGLNSIQTTRDRLVKAGASFQNLEIKDGIRLFRNPKQTMDKLAKLIPGLQKNVSGLTDFWFGAIQDSKLGTVPVYVPNILDENQKVLDIPTINRVINEELQKLETTIHRAIVYYVDVDDREELEKFIKDNNPTLVEIDLRDLKSILHEIVVEDEVEFNVEETSEGYEVEITKFVSDQLNQKINEFNEKGNLQALNQGKEFTPISISEEGLELIEFISLDCENEEGPWFSSSEIKIDKYGYVSVNGEETKEFWDGKIRAEKKPKRIKIRNISGDEIIEKVD